MYLFEIDTAELENRKNLLAFSAGVDSCALFFILLEKGIEFDLAIVDYGLREGSKNELSYARELADKYRKKLYTQKAPVFSSNLEKNMRDFRYHFFDTIIKESKYDNLITAHQLNDKLEWFLMQLGRGAGLVELMGLKKISYRKGYKVVRPLLDTSRDEIEEYLEVKGIKHFIDESNSDFKFQRNLIRAKFASKFVKEYKEGLKKSFSYLDEDTQVFDARYKKLQKLYVIDVFGNDTVDIRAVDKILKIEGILLSSAQKKEIMDTKDCVISARYVVSFESDKIFIAPYIKSKMPKKFKEECRIHKIPPKIRGYLYQKELLKPLLGLS